MDGTKMSDLIKRLRTAARKACERHNRVDQFDPAWERRPKDFIEWEAADEIELLQLKVDDLWTTLRFERDRTDRIVLLNAKLQAVVDGLCDMLEEVGVDSHSALAALEDE
jgi:hypothetical protein